jgi:choline-sulfatase
MRKDPWIPFDDLARVPFFVTGAGVAGGRRASHLVQNSDFALTCLDFAGVVPPNAFAFDSRSVRPILSGGEAASDVDRAVYSAVSVGWPMVRHGPYKLIAHHLPRRLPVLFDLDADPHERTNLAKDPAYAPVRAELAGLLDAMRAQQVVG